MNDSRFWDKDLYFSGRVDPHRLCFLYRPPSAWKLWIFAAVLACVSGCFFSLPLGAQLGVWQSLKRGEWNRAIVMPLVGGGVFVTLNAFQILLFAGGVPGHGEERVYRIGTLAYLWTCSQCLLASSFLGLWLVEVWLPWHPPVILFCAVLWYIGAMRLVFVAKNVCTRLQGTGLPYMEVFFCLDVWYVFWLCADRISWVGIK